jgi:pimeloyl-ACP methyl ester carboxylesterase
MNGQIAHTPLGPIEYTLLGSGPVILACHGTSSDCYSHQGYSPLLEAGFSILTPSRPGYGRTPLQTGRSAAQAAEALRALLDCLDIQTCGVMAISGGGPTGIAMAANHPERVRCLSMVAAISRPEARPTEPGYAQQKTFYGPLHGLMWGMLGQLSRSSPERLARQTMAIFSTHDPDDAMRQLTPPDIQAIGHFYAGRSSRRGALNDLTHTASQDLLEKIRVPTLVVHSREDASVPFAHAEWSLAHIPGAELCEAGFTGHFYWIGAGYGPVSQRMAAFVHSGLEH